MTIDELVPCYANTLFMRGADYATPDGPLSRIQTLIHLHSRVDDLQQPELVPYLGALTLHVLEQFSATHNHWDEPTTIVERIIPGLADTQCSMIHEIFNAWREHCPSGFVLLPRPIHDALVQLQTEYWTREIEGFSSTRFTQKHLEVAAL